MMEVDVAAQAQHDEFTEVPIDNDVAANQEYQAQAEYNPFDEEEEVLRAPADD